RSIATPGHTDAHAAFSVHVEDGSAAYAFTGGSLLLGATGRSDLLGRDKAEGLARQQHWSVRRMARLLAPETRIMPTHGFGSFCVAGSPVSSGDTVADQLSVNPAYLLGERVAVARRRLPHVAVTCADGRSLPYPDQSFDLVLQFTMFSSILDQGLCYTVANEMRRVLRPGGLLLWYDFWLNPTNRQTRGIRPREIRQYFPDSQYVFERITLAPPLTNHLVPFSWVAALSLERLGIFNTHYLAAIRPNR
ncbi:MAG TPA: methyltransferase domain-containing protein, partial [Promineifilum sp.]|nr:methyltransferase domain-containing protein [Promineifilum sp.]